MKLFATILFAFTSLSAFASGGGSSREDILFSLGIVAFLTVILGLVYLFEFMNRIRKDKDFREHLKGRALHLISTVRAIFIRRNKEEDEKPIDYSVSLALN